MDEIRLLNKGTAHELSSLVANMNKIYFVLKFTMETSETEVTYLDLKIFRGTVIRFNQAASLTLKSILSPLKLFNIPRP